MSLKTHAAPCALLIGACLAPASAQAADLAADLAAVEDPVTVVDSIIVTGRRHAEDPAVVAEARDRLSRTPGAVAVVSAESYADRFAQGFSDTLRNVPGVLAQKRYGEESRLSIRGSGIAQGFHQRGVLLAQDGVPFADADGFSDFQGVDALSARYVEVWKGSNTLRFGGAQLGGAINLVTPTGRTARQRALMQVEGGSYGFLRGHAAVAGTHGDWDLYAAATAMQGDGWRDHSEQSQGRLTVNAGRSFGEDREVRLIAQAADIKQDLPGPLTLKQALETPRMASTSALSGDQARDLTVKRLTLQTRWRFDESTLFEGAVWGWEKSLYHPIFQVMDQDSATRGAFGRIDWTGQVGGLRADAFYGFSWRDGAIDALRYVNLAGLRGAKTADARQEASGLDVFAEGRLFVTDRLALVAGGSWGRATRDYADRLTPANDDSVDYDWFSPRLGLLWEAEDGAQVFANLTRSVEPPTYGALVQAPLTGFAPVRVQDAWTAEIGTRGRRGPLAWDLTAYRSEIDGEMLNFITGPDIPAATFNADKTLHQGIEAGLDWTLPIELAGGSLMLRQVYNWSDFRFDGDARWGDNRLPVVPEHQYRAELTWRHPSGVFLTPSVKWRISSPFVDYANTLQAPDYAVLGLTGSFNVGANTSVYVDARNLTDERYVGEFSAVTDARTASTAVFFPGEGRSVFVGLRLAY
ncbi:TonB-dependent receptor [Brevundimonas naejangsanensis]|uniref:TonB-dependent receptor n=1 Tax=Brevundimonas naejangsanensis TaxID=588932 RepID=A0A494RFE1_9CAUL|nr:TonB-dependent receptor [Brevundimonas naejangsanensis]AYG93843.1 TonB-dependent receptor [Brevundimonas naejangsanensis]